MRHNALVPLVLRHAALLVGALLWSQPALAEDPGPWALPPDGACTRSEWKAGGADRGAERTVDAEPSPPMPGEQIAFEDLLRLRAWLPVEIWENRERFFFNGMTLNIGPCYRDYGAPPFYIEATRRFAGEARLGEGGELKNHRAGLPFLPKLIAPDDPLAGLKWAWNWVHRYEGAGAFGDLQLSVVQRDGVVERWQGNFFYSKFTGRADRAADGFRHPAKTNARWVAGGVSRNMQTGNQCAFRQYASGRRKPDYFTATSGSRKIRRQSAADYEGHFHACLVDGSIGGSLLAHGQEPPLHAWKVAGVLDLLAPINTTGDTFPIERERGYGPWGISFANDRWELRRVLVLDGRLQKGQFDDGTERFRWYLDLQTLQPLYYAAERRNGEAAGVGYWVWRWSEDRPDYPRWPDDEERPIRVLDQIGTAFVDWNDNYAVRSESGNRVSVPPPDKEINRMISLSRVRVR